MELTASVSSALLDFVDATCIDPSEPDAVLCRALACLKPFFEARVGGDMSAKVTSFLLYVCERIAYIGSSDR